MLNELLAMGGYGMYVWPAYGITFAVFTLNLFIALKEKNQIKKLLKATQHEVSGES